jgi:hypothetical protein
MVDRQKQTKYTDSNDMARGAKGDCVTRVDVAPLSRVKHPNFIRVDKRRHIQ